MRSLPGRKAEGGPQGLESEVGCEDPGPLARCPRSRVSGAHACRQRSTPRHAGPSCLPSLPLPSHSCGRATINNEKAPLWAQELSHFQNAFLLPSPLIFLWFGRKAPPWPSFLLPQEIKKKSRSHPSKYKISVLGGDLSMQTQQFPRRQRGAGRREWTCSASAVEARGVPPETLRAFPVAASASAC